MLRMKDIMNRKIGQLLAGRLVHHSLGGGGSSRERRLELPWLICG